MTASKKIRTLYFASLREQSGQKEEAFMTHCETARELYEELSFKYKFSLPLQAVRVVVNNAFSSWDVRLKENDCVVFIPPVSGG